MKKPDYVYVTAIAAPKEVVWKGLTTAEFTRQYWHGTDIDSDFREGSPVRFRKDGEVACEGQVLVADAPNKLAYTWHFPRNPETATEAPSRVTFLLEAISQGTRLTVIHDQFEPGSKTYEMVRNGWPLVIAGLKTLLESGTAVDFSAA
jgi:uncharacterized protein YndB with AHSA1/START domain